MEGKLATKCNQKGAKKLAKGTKKHKQNGDNKRQKKSEKRLKM